MSDVYAQAVKDGWITQKQSEKLNPSYLNYLIARNKKRGHHPKHVSDAEWAAVKTNLKAKRQKVPPNPSRAPPAGAKKTKKHKHNTRGRPPGGEKEKKKKT
jgi:hypothetical protein